MNENKANFAKIGFFVLAGAALIVLVIGIAGARTFNKKVIDAETYFAESVTGLDLGSPVKYRGVPVGEVKRIGFVYSEYGKQNDDLLTQASARQILVVMALDPERFGLLGNQAADQILRAMVQQGLRVKIAAPSAMLSSCQPSPPSFWSWSAGRFPSGMEMSRRSGAEACGWAGAAVCNAQPENRAAASAARKRGRVMAGSP